MVSERKASHIANRGEREKESKEREGERGREGER